jgi:predicted Co/Zn/Cd cation transporter (cation efflux family)
MEIFYLKTHQWIAVGILAAAVIVAFLVSKWDESK